MIKEISSISSKKIKISSWEWNTIFDNTSWKKIIKRQLILGKNSDLELYWIIYASSNYELEIFLDGTNSNLKVNYLLLGDKNSKIKFKINSKILASKSKSNISIISMVANYWDIEVDGNIKIDKWLEEIEANIFEENVFLWDTGKIRAIPALEIHSQDIRASHSLKIEKISNEKLFYLRSRW
jgi:Fe-S cluster assembly protein SufB